MKKAIFLLALFSLLLASTTLAADSYDLSWHIISGGGGHIKAGAYTLQSAVVQPAGEMSGGLYALQTGFCYGLPVAEVVAGWAYLPVIIRSFALP